MNVSNLAVWNGLFYGKERKIVQKISNNHDGYDLWVAVYHIGKASGSPLDKDFIRNATSDYCIITFKYKSGTNLEEDGFILGNFIQLEVIYTDKKDEILTYLGEHKVSLELFQYPINTDFPMGT